MPDARPARPPRLLLIDDDLSFHSFLADLLGRGRAQVVACVSGAEGLRLLRESAFDLVLVDYQLPDMLGLEILEAMQREHYPAPRVLVTGYATVEVAVRAMKLGAADLFTKPLSDPAAFVRFLNRTLALDPLLPLPLGAAPAVAAPAEPDPDDEPGDESPPAAPEAPETMDVERLCARVATAASLSEREAEVLEGLLGGLANKEIAARLHISDRTVKSHVTQLFRKFGVESRSQLFTRLLTERS